MSGTQRITVNICGHSLKLKLFSVNMPVDCLLKFVLKRDEWNSVDNCKHMWAFFEIEII